MSRSGTSAITRILSLAGMSLPANLMEPNIGNPTGYWKPAEVVALNDAFLESRRSSYYDRTLFVQSDDAAFDSDAARAFVSEIAEFIASHGHDEPVLIKDPRLAALAHIGFAGRRLPGDAYSASCPYAIRVPSSRRSPHATARRSNSPTCSG